MLRPPVMRQEIFLEWEPSRLFKPTAWRLPKARWSLLRRRGASSSHLRVRSAGWSITRACSLAEIILAPDFDPHHVGAGFVGACPFKVGQRRHRSPWRSRYDSQRVRGAASGCGEANRRPLPRLINDILTFVVTDRLVRAVLDDDLAERRPA